MNYVLKDDKPSTLEECVALLRAAWAHQLTQAQYDTLPADAKALFEEVEDGPA